MCILPTPWISPELSNFSSRKVLVSERFEPLRAGDFVLRTTSVSPLDHAKGQRPLIPGKMQRIFPLSSFSIRRNGSSPESLPVFHVRFQLKVMSVGSIAVWLPRIRIHRKRIQIFRDKVLQCRWIGAMFAPVKFQCRGKNVERLTPLVNKGGIMIVVGNLLSISCAVFARSIG